MSSKKYGGRFHKGISSFCVPRGVEPLAIENFLSGLDCPRSLSVYLMFKYNEHKQLVDLEFNPLHYNSVEEARVAYAATKFLSKFVGLNPGIDKDEVAMQKFFEFELLCKQTNSRFRDLARDPKFRGHAVGLHNAVVRKIAQILGDYSPDEIFSLPDWGPGASTLIKRKDASPAKKFRCETGITRDLYNLIPYEIMEVAYPLWSRVLVDSGYPNFQVGNKVITVPKDSKTNRVIAVEPGINLWFQKSAGEMIGRRLRRCGIDLRYQSRNQKLAQEGLSLSLATIDLASASDSIARLVVEELLPPRWVLLLDACRSHYGTHNGTLMKWDKFSSMGNGFTFQLESLIFYAVSYCCAEYCSLDTSLVSAYGDDVIIPVGCYEIFTEMMDFYGFRVNVKKSHYDSPFRESCGAHFFSGVDIKPIYLKDRVDSIPAIYRLANAIRRFSHRKYFRMACDSNFRLAFEHLVDSVPEAYRFRISESIGDGGFISNFDEATPSRVRKGIGAGYQPAPFSCPNVVEVSKTYYDETVGYLLASLWQLKQTDELDFLHRRAIANVTLAFGISHVQERRARFQAIDWIIRPLQKVGYNSVPLNGRTKYRLVNSLVQQWYDLGPWL